MHILKYCCPKKKKRFLIPKKFKIGITFILIGLILLLIIADGVVRSVISDYPMKVSTGIITKMMDNAMDEVLINSNISPTTVDNVVYDNSGKVISVETDTTQLIKIKTEFTTAFYSLLKENGNIIKISVPIGTLIGHEYTIGRGPKISFNLQYTSTVNAELKSVFTDAGVNNTLHTIELCVTNHIYVIIPWGHNSQTVSTKYIVAETVIVGDVPEAFTNINGADDEITDDIVDHGAKID